MAEQRTDRRRRQVLESERDFLVRSIEDLELEHRAGDLDEVDFATLRAGYLERLEENRQALGVTVVEPADAGEALPVVLRLRRRLGRRSTRKVLIGVASGCFVAVLVLVALLLAGVRLPGQTATGTVTLPANETTSQQLAAAQLLGTEDQFTEAISLYDSILAGSPGNTEARTYRAWLIRTVGISADATDEIRSADATIATVAREHPGYAPAQVFLGVADLDDHADPHAAGAAFTQLLADKPGAAFLNSAGPTIVAAYSQVRAPLPETLRAALAAALHGTAN